MFFNKEISGSLSVFTSITVERKHCDFHHVPQILKVMFAVELRRQE